MGQRRGVNRRELVLELMLGMRETKAAVLFCVTTMIHREKGMVNERLGDMEVRMASDVNGITVYKYGVLLTYKGIILSTHGPNCAATAAAHT